MWTTRYVTRDPVKVVDEIELYTARYGATDFHLQDLTAIVNRRWIIRFCDEILRRQLDIVWQLPSGTRCEAIDEEVCEKLAATGCKNLSFAPESGSPRLLKAMRKQVDLDRMLRVIKTAWRFRLGVDCFVLWARRRRPRKRCGKRCILSEAGLDRGPDVGISMFVPYPARCCSTSCWPRARSRWMTTTSSRRSIMRPTRTASGLRRGPHHPAVVPLAGVAVPEFLHPLVCLPSHPHRDDAGQIPADGPRGEPLRQVVPDRLKTRRRWRKAMDRLGSRPAPHQRDQCRRTAVGAPPWGEALAS